MPCTECARIENGIVYLRNEFDFLYGIWLVSSLVWLFHMNTLRCAHIHTHTPAHKMNGHVDVKPLFIQSTVFVLLREGDGRSMGGLNIKTTQWMQSRRIACTRITQSAAPPKKERKIYTHIHTFFAVFCTHWHCWLWRREDDIGHGARLQCAHSM